MRHPNLKINPEPGSAPPPAVGRGWLHPLLLGAALVLLLYLCWRMLLPFLPALCWAFALAVIAHPVYSWLVRRRLPRNLAALATVVLVAALVIIPALFLARALVREAADVVNRIAAEAQAGTLRTAVEHNRLIGPMVRWLGDESDLAQEGLQLIRSLAGWASASASAVLARSLWLLSQIGVTLFVLFYFLRDGQDTAGRLRRVAPLPAADTEWLFARIALTIRVSFAAKIVVAALQGALGGLMFYWLGLPAPVFWGFLMALLSLFPVVGSFVVWAPVAAGLAWQGHWSRALLLAGWGLLVIHPVDNLLGPILVGSKLRTHSLFMFFAVIGGLAAFGASGIVLGPLLLAVVAALVDLAERRASQR